MIKMFVLGAIDVSIIIFSLLLAQWMFRYIHVQVTRITRAIRD